MHKKSIYKEIKRFFLAYLYTYDHSGVGHLGQIVGELMPFMDH